MSDLKAALPKSLLLENVLIPQSYELSLVIDHKKPNFSGSVVVPLQPNKACVEKTPSTFCLTLHVNKIIATKAELKYGDQHIPLKITNSRDVQTVSFSADTPVTDITDKSPKVEIQFMGSVTQIKTFRDETYGVFKTNYSDSVEGKSDNFVIATHAQPFGCRSIFPVVDENVHKVPIKLTLTTKSVFKVVSNGTLEKSTIVDMTPDSVFEFKQTPPIAPSVFGFAIGDFEVVESALKNVPIRVFATKGDGSKAAYALRVASELLPRFSALFGTEYPLDKFDMVALPFLSDWVMENWGMVTVIKDSLLVDESAAQESEKLQLRQLIAHQLTHQWIGNLVTFDDFKWMWLNEAFATWVGNYVLSLARIEDLDGDNYQLEKVWELEALKDLDCSSAKPTQSLYDHMSSLDITLKSKTNTIFEKNAYDKGMVLLNMVGSLFLLEHQGAGFELFFAAFHHVLSAYEYRTVKPFEMWSVLNEAVSVDLLSFVHSWVQYTGYPVVTVRCGQNKLVIEQNRYLSDATVDEAQIENQPFHVPLAIKVQDDQGSTRYANIVLSDRSMELEIPPAQLVTLNAARLFYYSVVYDKAAQSHILDHISANKLSPEELVGIISDYGKILGQAVPPTNPDLYGAHELAMVLRICGAVAADGWKIDFHVLKVLLGYIEEINTTFVHFSEYTQFEAWLARFTSKLFAKIARWDAVTLLEQSHYNSVEYEVRAQVLQLGSRNRECQDVCKKLYKNFIHGGVAHKFIPRELLQSMFNVTMAHASMNEYKQVLGLVKNGNVSYLRHTNASAHELQTAAVASLAFTTKDELLSKTLHFVSSNIDSKLIELALLGFKYHHSPQAKQKVWAWYRVNYDQWIKRSLRKGSDWSKQIGVSVGNITRLLLGEVMQYDRDAAVAFVEQKLALLPPHGLRERFEAVERENREKREMARWYDVVGSCK